MSHQAQAQSPSASQGASVLRLRIRGLILDAKCREGRVIDLVVNTNDKHGTFWRRAGQNLAHALYRIADRLHSCNYDRRGLRVVTGMMRRDPTNDSLADLAHFHVAQLISLDTSNSQAHYNTFLINESVKRHEYDLAAKLGIVLTGQKRTDDSQSFALHSILPDQSVVVSQDTTA